MAESIGLAARSVSLVYHVWSLLHTVSNLQYKLTKRDDVRLKGVHAELKPDCTPASKAAGRKSLMRRKPGLHLRSRCLVAITPMRRSYSGLDLVDYKCLTRLSSRLSLKRTMAPRQSLWCWVNMVLQLPMVCTLCDYELNDAS